MAKASDVKVYNEVPTWLNGMNVDEYTNNAWMEIGDVRSLDLTNQMMAPDWDDEKSIPELIVKTCRNAEYIHFICKYILNVDILPFQGVILDMLWNKPLPMLIASRGASKTFCISLYVILRALISQGCKIVIAGASLRQSLLVYNYIQEIWDKAPVLRDICGGRNGGPKRDIHMAYWDVGLSKCMFLPLGQGDKIRGIRASVIVADEFSSIPHQIFETVIRGFAAVKSEGLHQNVAKEFKKRLISNTKGAEELIAEDEEVGTLMKGNQIVIGGTAYYQFNHFYKYYKYYTSIIKTQGDKRRLKELFPDMHINDNLDPSDYAVMQLPWNFVPPGMMDEKILTQGRATMDPTIYSMEYLAEFPSDSAGFYLATMINASTCPVTTDKGKINGKPKMYGDKELTYVMGMDPASEDDNFAINLIEIHESYRLVVYQWKTNRKDFEKLQRDGVLDPKIKDYNTFCLTQIRTLMRRFNIAMIVCDTGGGGVSIKEGLKDPTKFLDTGDKPILDMDDEANKNVEGLKILKMIEFSSYEWRQASHYGLRDDIMKKTLLFPEYDAAEAEEAFQSQGVGHDTLDDCYAEILECKSEIILIKLYQTETGKQRWDTPDVKGVDGNMNKKSLKKDRFTSLLLSNWGCRLLGQKGPENPDIGGGMLRGQGQGHSTPGFYGMVTSANGRRICF